MKLLNLKLTNFQGLRDFTLDTEGKSINIFSDNGLGKTTIFNAVTWLLFDKSSTGAKNFSPKTRGTDGEELHNLENSVEGRFSLDDGKIVTFKKALHEVYRQKRGSAESEYAGNTVDYFINGVPVKANAYQAEIANACGPIDHVMMILMPDYFAETMSWQDRRKVLLSVCGDKTDMEIIESSPKLAELKELLIIPGTTDQMFTVDEYKAIVTSRMKDINKRLDDIPTRIDEASRAIKDVELLNKAEIQVTIKGLEKRLAELEKQPAADDALAEAKRKFEEEKAEEITRIRGEIDTAQDKMIALKRELAEWQDKWRMAAIEHDRRKQLREELVAKLSVLSNAKWDENNEYCPTCHRKLEADEIAKARRAFADDINTQIKELNAQGAKECTKAEIEKWKAIYDKADSEVQRLNGEITKLGDKKIALETALQTARATRFDETSIYTTPTPSEAEPPLHDGIQDLSVDLKGHLDDERAKLARIDLAETQKQRIVELETEEKNLAREYQKAERANHLCEVFMITKVDAITEGINEHFKNVRFRLFQMQINGGIKEDCEVLIPCGDRLIPYTFANTAGRMNAGLEIISVLSKAFGRTMPVIVDNAEAISKNNWKTIEGTQMIRLYVSGEDKTLRIEKE